MGEKRVSLKKIAAYEERLWEEFRLYRDRFGGMHPLTLSARTRWAAVSEIVTGTAFEEGGI